MHPGGENGERSELLQAVRNEAEVLHELWRLTGFDRRQAPPREIIKEAYWAEQELHAIEGSALRLVPANEIWGLDTHGETCGVDPFSSTAP